MYRSFTLKGLPGTRPSSETCRLFLDHRVVEWLDPFCVRGEKGVKRTFGKTPSWRIKGPLPTQSGGLCWHYSGSDAAFSVVSTKAHRNASVTERDTADQRSLPPGAPLVLPHRCLLLTRHARMSRKIRSGKGRAASRIDAPTAGEVDSTKTV